MRIASSFDHANGTIRTVGPLPFTCLAIALTIGPARAQVASYTIQNTLENYAPLSGGTVLCSGAFDDAVYAVELPGPFWYDGAYQTKVYVSTNGFITFGSAPAVDVYRPLNSTAGSAGAIAVFAANLRNNGDISIVRQVSWSLRGQEAVFEWRGIRRYVGGTQERLQFQLGLDLATGAVRMTYGSMQQVNPSNSQFPQVGLRGAGGTLPDDLNALTCSAGQGSWALPDAGTQPQSTMRFTSAPPVASPAAGRTYRWLPTCVPPRFTQAFTITDCIHGQFSVQLALSALNAASANVELVGGGVVATNITPGVRLVGPFAAGTAVLLRIVPNGTGACTGILGPFSAQNCLANGACAAPGIAIPDKGCLNGEAAHAEVGVSGVPNTLGPAPHQAFLAGIDLIIEHTDRSDLRVVLTSPGGQTRDLVLNRGGHGDNYGAPSSCPDHVFRLSDGAPPLSSLPANPGNDLTGTYAPEQSLAGFSGDPNGVWTLTVCDDHLGEHGRVRLVRIDILERDCAGTPGGTAFEGTICDDGDPNTVGDTWDADCVCLGTPLGCSQNEVVLDLTTDGQGSQTSWVIVPAGGGAPVCSGSGYGNNVTVTEARCLPDGCYRLVVSDAFGDGMCCDFGNGGYVLRTADGDRIIDNGEAGLFGATSQIANGGEFCLPLGTDRIKPSRCDLMDLLPTDWIGAVENATVSAQWGVGDQTDDGYQFWFFDPNGSYSRRVFISHATNNYLFPFGPARCSYIRLSNIISYPLPHNLLLNVRVRTMVNGVYSAFGPACRLMIDTSPANCPTTQLVDDPGDPHHSCNITNVVLDGSQHLWADYVSSTVLYQFEFYDPLNAWTRRISNPGSALLLTQWANAPLEYGRMYEVRVRVSYDNGASYCPFGPACTIMTASTPPSAQPRSLTADTAPSPITLWPNPVHDDRLYLSVNDPTSSETTVAIEMYDVLGAQVMARRAIIRNGRLDTTLELARSLNNGIYTLQVRMNGTVGVHRIVLAR
ncbi:MAG: proprotein convertase P-domain-containing protein [Flavobacteriales bacterium]|nr:proprotein convertase P-domain-containing protein [Flavobacteriales bacterium]MCB9167725.1 proprotein convertase P-domain-containing protein [Flavobacteriales bacterium]